MNMFLSAFQAEDPVVGDVSGTPEPGKGFPLQSQADSDTEYSSSAVTSKGTVSGGDAEYSSSASTSEGTVSGGDAGAGSPYIPGTVADPYDYTQYLETLVTDSGTLTAQMDRIQAQNEACISLLLIIVIVGMLNYVYKFFKIFF